MWYGAMGTLQILMFGLIAIKIKSKAPGAHTMPEIVLARHGKVAHITYLYHGLATNMLVGACLVLGGAQVVDALTGMNVYAATFLIPAVVAAYVIAGGLRSTFIADYTHTVILFVAILVFGFLTITTSDLVGSPARLYELLQEASENMPIDRNTGGSYLTFRSVGGLIFAFDLFVSSFTTVWLDQAYWQRAIASKPETSVKAYIFGGLAWYGMLGSSAVSAVSAEYRQFMLTCGLLGIPFGFATIMGLGCAALTGNPRFPTYPNALTTAQVESGLSAPATAIALLGKGGAVLMLILLFMAVTSSTSAELIAVSSLLTFDIYKTYFRPNTTSEALVRVSHWGIVLYAIVLAVFCCILNAAGISLTWVLTVLGVIVGGAALPVGMILLWEPMSTVAAVAAPWIGFVCGITVWFVTAYKRSGTINVATTGDTTNALAGNLASFGMGFIMAVVLTFVFPGKHADPNAQALAGVAVPVKEENPTSETGRATAADKAQTPSIDGKTTPPPISSEVVSPAPATRNELIDYLESHEVEPMDPVLVKRGERIALTANAVFFFGAVILVPFALFGSSYIYSKSFFTGWVVVSFIWIWISVLICVVWPVVESLGALRGISSGLWMDFKSLLGYRKKMGNSETV
jgi:Na+/proline symporter